MIELVIVSRLLEYPDAALWQHQQEMFEALASSEKLSKEDAHALGVFLRDLVAQDPLDAQAAYSELFDRGRATSLLLFEHVHGESRDRGQAMVDLMAQYERHGLLLDSHELPDHLPLYLEYLAQLPEEEALGGLRDVAPILGLLSARLQRRYQDRITGSFAIPGREGRYAPIPDSVPPALAAALKARGIEQLYSHQAEAWEASQRGEHVAIVTPTASGKSLCYTLPVVSAAMQDKAKALYLFPTKALAQDQVAELLELNRAGD
ncbi:MAG: nitrate reductase molybdenum cofactor assembly chaperone, partial [Enterobacter hormaechei]|nr:nitrate reductase molybdenum cofactor assembly chaperone [Enterobacter hormaechei]